MTEEMRSLTGEQLKIGMSAEKTKTMTKEDIEYFGKVSTDTNPMHFNEEYAATTQFGKCIAHGVISLSFCGSILGMLHDIGRFEQIRCFGIHLGQEVTSKKPVYPGDVITAHCEVADIQYKEKAGFYVVKIKQWVKNQNGDIVTEGVATVMPPKVSVEIPK